MRTPGTLVFAAALAWLSIAIPVAATGEEPTEQAMRLANQGKIDGAIQVLRDHLKGNPKDVKARVVLGRILDFDGRPDEAATLWEAGLADADTDFPLWMAIGEIRRRQGTDGPTISRQRGMITASPSKDKAAEDRYKRARLAEAATAYRKARTLRPDEPEASKALASVYGLQEKHDDAVGVWKTLVELEPRNGDHQLGLALATQKAGRDDEASRYLERAIELKPRFAQAHEALAASREKQGRAAEAEQSRKRAAFYERIPSFCTIAYSEDHLKTLDKLHQPETVRKLVDDPSEQAAEFLATLCWTHPHDRLETQAFDALEARGARTTRLLRALLDEARSTCTIKSTAHILARRKLDGMYDYLVERLPGDLRGFAMDMDIAGSLDDLGDPRAVAPLIQLLDPGDGKAPRGDPLSDRDSARARAAMALGAFDTPEARRALEAGTRDPRIAAYCLAALYRLTKDPKHLAALEKAVGPDDGYTTYVLGGYLQRKAGTDEAKTLAQAWEKRREVQRAAEEARKKQEAAPKPKGDR